MKVEIELVQGLAYFTNSTLVKMMLICLRFTFIKISVGVITFNLQHRSLSNGCFQFNIIHLDPHSSCYNLDLGKTPF